MTAKIRFEDDDELIDICKDNVFKAVFTRNTPASQGALSRLVSALICRQVSIVGINANEPPVDSLRDRQIRYDISCRAESGELINVEMSLNPDTFEPVRLEFHAGKLFTGQDIRGVDKDYGDLKLAYQIALLGSGRFFPDEAFFHTFEYYDKAHGISLNGRSSIITLELSKLGKVVEKPAWEMNAQELWAVYFKYLTDKNKRGMINEILSQEEGIAMASEVLKTISKDDAEWFRRMSEEKYELDMQSKMVQAKRLAMKEGREEGRQEGRQEGREEGRQEGREEGREEGRQEGREEGRQEGEQEIIDLLKSGKSPEEIIKIYDRQR